VVGQKVRRIEARKAPRGWDVGNGFLSPVGELVWEGAMPLLHSSSLHKHTNKQTGRPRFGNIRRKRWHLSTSCRRCVLKTSS